MPRTDFEVRTRYLFALLERNRDVNADVDKKISF